MPKGKNKNKGEGKKKKNPVEIQKELKLAKFNELKPHLTPFKPDSKLLVPKVDSDSDTKQEWLRCNIDNKIRILCIDGRLFEGLFHCIDADRNIILSNAQWINAGINKTETKPVGMSLYTKQWIQKVYFSTPQETDLELEQKTVPSTADK